MISSAYQYYLTEYGHRESSRYETHKKSELKGAYNNIVRLNKKTPLYKIDLSESTQRLLIDLKENSRIFQNRLYEIFGTKDSEGDLQRKTTYSSNPEALDVKYIGDEELAEDTVYSVKINRLAMPQINTGDFVPSDKPGLAPGNYSFDLNIGDNAYEFQFKVPENSTNLTLQEKLTRLINRSNVGISAQVIRDANGSSAIELTSVRTGSVFQKRMFSFSDNNPSGETGSVEFLGLNNMRQASSDAVIEINGQSTTSASNDFTIEKKFLITLKSTGDGEPIEIGFHKSPDMVFEQLELFADSYNKVYKLTENNETGNLAGRKLKTKLDGMVNVHSKLLDSIGLSRDENGYIHADKTAVTTAFQNGALDRGCPELIRFQKTLINETQLISANPFEYVNKTMIAYPNPQHPASTPYQTSIYAGLLLNGYI